MHFSTIFAPAAMLLGTVSAAINSVTYTGSGCPPGGLQTIDSSNMLTRTTIFTSYVINASTRSKDCVIQISYTVPAGWASSTLKADYRGYTLLASGGRTTLSSPGGGLVINGPYDDNWFRSESTAVSGAAGTTQTVTVSTSLVLGNTVGASNTGFVDSIDISFLKRS
jgi:hypothetical protein